MALKPKSKCSGTKHAKIQLTGNPKETHVCWEGGSGKVWKACKLLPSWASDHAAAGRRPGLFRLSAETPVRQKNHITSKTGTIVITRTGRSSDSQSRARGNIQSTNICSLAVFRSQGQERRRYQKIATRNQTMTTDDGINISLLEIAGMKLHVRIHRDGQRVGKAEPGWTWNLFRIPALGRGSSRRGESTSADSEEATAITETNTL
ncbi:hypothetical protein DFH06DRAFT_1129474 [Mycena polygramma]|nr:hypothetical protein DFH06DRAFT_1129474 [Mycena polygramma]